MVRSLNINGSIILAVLGIAGFTLATSCGKKNDDQKPVKADTFSLEVAGLADAEETDVVALSDGASYDLTVAPIKQRIAGQTMRRLAYNGSIPGPTIRVKQGATVKLTVTNHGDVDTTLHPHGVRTTSANDGVPGIGQEPIKVGESYTYELTFPDPGVYWYHPHVREDYAQDGGLYGNVIVEPADASYYNPVHREIALMLDDVSANADADPYYRDRVTHTLMGRFGNVLLINGSDDFKLTGTAGEVLRLYLTNAANTRVFRFRVTGAKLKVVGGDLGVAEQEAWTEAVTLAPGERSIVELQLPHGRYEIVNDKPGGAEKMGLIETDVGEVPALAAEFETLRSGAAAHDLYAKARAALDAPVKRTFQLTLAMSGGNGMGGMKDDGNGGDMGDMKHDGNGGGGMGDMGSMGHGLGETAGDKIEWDEEMADMNAASDDKSLTWKIVDEATQQENMAIEWSLRTGVLVKVRFVNDAAAAHPMQHPMHFHGQRFVVTAVDGKPVEMLSWKDTVLIGAGETVDLLLDASNPGNWLAHCHILEHAAAGMTMPFSVGE